MSHSKLLVSIFSILILSSCVTSLHNVVTYDKIAQEARISGMWMHEGLKIRIDPLLKSEIYLSFQKESKGNKSAFEGESETDSIMMINSYVFSFTDNGIRHDMLGSFIRLDGLLYVDLSPLIAGSLDHLYPGAQESHSFARVDFDGRGRVELKFLSSEFIRKQFENERIAIKHEQDEMTGNYIITASSRDLQQFLIKYGRDKRLYDEESTVILNKIS